MAIVVVELFTVVILFFVKGISTFFLKIVLIAFYLGFSSHVESISVLRQSAMFYWQVMNSLISTTDIWPQWINKVQVRGASTFNFQFSSLSCLFPIFSTPFAKSIVLFVAPFICILLVWMTSLIVKARKKIDCKYACSQFRELALKLDFDNCRRYTLDILDLAYFPIAESCIAVLSGCNEIDGMSFLKEFPWISSLALNMTGYLLLQ